MKYEGGSNWPPEKKTTLKKPSLIRVKKIEKSEVKRGSFIVLTEEATDISNIHQLLIFIRFYDSEKMPQIPFFVNTSDLLFESKNTAPYYQSIYLNLKNLIVNDLSLRLLHFHIFCFDGVTCHCWEKGRHCYQVLTRWSMCNYSKHALH